MVAAVLAVMASASAEVPKFAQVPAQPQRDTNLERVAMMPYGGGTLGSLGELGSAEDDIKAMKMHRAWLLEQKDRYDRAIEVYGDLLSHYPSYFDAWMARAQAELWLRRDDDAMQDFNKAVELAPGNEVAGAYIQRCFAQAVIGKDYAAALADCNKSMEIAPNETDNLSARGFVRYRMGDLAAAKTDLDAALLRHGGSPDSLYVRGLVKKAQGDTSGGDADIAAAERIDSKIAETYAAYRVTP